MRPSFHPRLVNGPFDDPGLFIPFQFENRAILFDLGEIGNLSSRDILKVSHAFVSHTHMDHFIGFDALLRIFLGRDKSICLYGPEGFLKNVEGKLAGYSWNLVHNYDNRFILEVFEIQQDFILHKAYACADRFSPAAVTRKLPFNHCPLEESAFNVCTVLLDHDIPCLGFSLEEHFHVNINKDALLKKGIGIGPWLAGFKRALYDGHHMNEDAVMIAGDGVSYNLQKLAQEIAIITPGQKITYISDAAYSKSGAEKMVEFAKNADVLFIEAAFLDKDRELAETKYHLTAKQSGEIAGKAHAKAFEIFHFSPRYMGMEHLLYREAQKAYIKHKKNA